MNLIKNFAQYCTPHRLVILICLLYLISRGISIIYFVPHNDEMIYTESSLRIADNWDYFWSGSMDGKMQNEYKKPFQFWVNSLTVKWLKDPLFANRLWAYFFGLCGILFTQLLMWRAWNPQAAVWTGFLILISENQLLFDSLAMNEAFLYGMGAVYLYCLYDLLERRRWLSGLIGSLFCAGVVMTKTSGLLWCGFALLIPLLLLAQQSTTLAQAWQVFKTNGWKWYALTGGTLAIAGAIHHVLIPPQFDSIKSPFESLFIRSLPEILAFPIDSWSQNLTRYFKSLTLEFSFFLIPLLLAIVVTGVWLYRRQRDAFGKYLVLILLWVTAFGFITIVGKVVYVRYYGMGFYFLFMVLGAVLAVGAERLKPLLRYSVIAFGVPVLIAVKVVHSYVPLVQWGQTDMALHETPPGWANGAGIRELIEKVSQLEPSLLISDYQWGHPLTALVAFQGLYPQVTVMDIHSYLDTPGAYQHFRSQGKKFYLAFDMRTPGSRPKVDDLLNNPSFCHTREVIKKQYRDHVFENSALILCTVKLP